LVRSKSLTSAAICTVRSEASNCVIGPTPDTPCVRFCQNSATLLPIGVTAPEPGHYYALVVTHAVLFV